MTIIPHSYHEQGYVQRNARIRKKRCLSAKGRKNLAVTSSELDLLYPQSILQRLSTVGVLPDP